MRRQFLHAMLALLLLALAALPGAPAATALAQEDEEIPPFTGTVWLTTDPDDFERLSETTFTADTERIYGAIALRWWERTGSQQDVPVEITFFPPSGKPWREVEWLDDDVVTISDEYFAESNAFKLLDLSDAQGNILGQWHARFSVQGQQVAVVSFNIVSGDNPAETGAFDIEAETTARGYEFLGAQTEFQPAEDGTPISISWLLMPAVSLGLEDERLAIQVLDGFEILSEGFPASDFIWVWLNYSEQIQLAYWTAQADWELYSSGEIGAEEFLAGYVTFWALDLAEGRFLTGEEAVDFVNKDFSGEDGSNTTTDDPLTPDDNGSNPAVGGVRLEVSTLVVPADPSQRVTIVATVLGAGDEPVVDAEIVFELSGSAGGRLRPKITTTDEGGVAEATYTPGTENGTATITARAGGSEASITIQVGEGGGDEPEGGFEEVTTFLEDFGYNVRETGFLEDNPAWPYVAMDAISPEAESHAIQAVFGWAALDQSIDSAEFLTVYLLYDRYMIVWSTARDSYQAWIAEEIDDDTFVADVTNVVFDVETGEEVEPETFYNKDFTP